MTYKETLDFLFSSLPQFQRIGAAAYKNNLDNTIELDNHFEHPHRQFKTIHVGGTNGKGSVSSMIQSVLVKAGYKVGMYTSPHLTDFRERITINGEMMPESEVVDFVAKNITIIEKLKPSFFEMTVAMAFDYFRNQKVDIAVIEVGMGGRLDSTNIIEPMASVITNISYDHVSFLGNTLDKIATEKAGIIKTKTPVVIGQSDSVINEVFDDIARKMSAPIIYADARFKTDMEQMDSDIVEVLDTETNTKETFKLTLKGDCQKYNLITALALIDVIKEELKIAPKHIKQGLEVADIRGRWQIVDNEPLVICDTAHNIAGLRFTVEQIMRQQYKKLFIILGVVSDKDVENMLMLMPKGATYLFTAASVERAMSPDELNEKASYLGLDGKAVPTVKEAYEKARKMAKKNDMIFVGGSTFVVADLLNLLEK